MNGRTPGSVVTLVTPVFVEQTYWEHYSVASRARHHLWCANHTRNHTAAQQTPDTRKPSQRLGFKEWSQGDSNS